MKRKTVTRAGRAVAYVETSALCGFTMHSDASAERDGLIAYLHGSAPTMVYARKLVRKAITKANTKRDER